MAKDKAAAGKSNRKAASPGGTHGRPASSSAFLEWDSVPDPPRVSRQTDQELASKSALVTWLYQHEWKSNRPEIDLGQDLWVEIYENQRSTGLCLNIQHKSAFDIDSYKLKNSPHLSYPIEVKDLLHWRKQAVPVLLIVCDVRCDAERYWISIGEIIEHLEQTNSSWMHEKSVQVRIPLSNRLDDEALLRIRHLLADHFFPSIARKYSGIKFGVKFAFPTTPEGIQKRQTFENFLNTGQPVTIEKKYIADFRASEWFELLYGRHTPESLTFGKPSSQEVYRFRLEVQSTDGTIVPAQAIELRFVQSGRYEAILSNKHQNLPLVFNFKLMNYPDRRFVDVNFTMVHSGNTVFESRDAMLFFIAVAEGNPIQLIENSSGKMVNAGSVSVDVHFSLEEFKAQAELIKKLCFLQARFQFSPVLSVRGKYLTEEDWRIIDKLYTICQTGRYAGPQILSMTYNGEGLRADKESLEATLASQSEQMSIQLTVPERLTLLGRTIEFGSASALIKLNPEQSQSYREQLKQAVEKKLAKVIVTIPDAAMDFTYLDWKRDETAFGFKVSPNPEKKQKGKLATPSKKGK